MISKINGQNQSKYTPSFKQKLIPTTEEAEFFLGEYPLLGKFIPQHCFGFQQYDGTEFTRYMVVAGCSVCSKLSIYDKLQQIGFYSHVDSEHRLMKTLDKIKARIFQQKMNPEELVGTDSHGIWLPNADRIQVIKNFFIELGLKEENIHQPTNKELAFDGEILDLKDGELYDLNTLIHDSHVDGKITISDISTKFKDNAKALQRALEQYQIRRKLVKTTDINYYEV